MPCLAAAFSDAVADGRAIFADSFNCSSRINLLEWMQVTANDNHLYVAVQVPCLKPLQKDGDEKKKERKKKRNK